ncbi:hypothetical protein ABZP36_018836 [Zizania latifolia]
MAYSGDRGFSPPARPHGTFSYFSSSPSRPSPSTVTAPLIIPATFHSPSPCPDFPAAPSYYLPWTEPLASYIDPVFTQPCYSGIANTDGFLVTDSAPRRLQERNPLPNDCYSAYDSYLAHLPSYSTYQSNYGLYMPSVSASPEVCGVTKTVPSEIDPVLVDPFLQYTNPYRFNLGYFGSMENERKDRVGFQAADRHFGDWNSSATGMWITGKNPCSSYEEIYNVGDHSITRRPVELSFEVKPDLSLQASYSKISEPKVGFPQNHNNFMESPEANNLVASTCWKGTPSARWISFGVLENNEPSSTNGLDDIIGSQKFSGFSTKNSRIFSEYNETSNPLNNPSLPCCTNFFSALKLPSEYKRSERHKDILPSDVGSCNVMANHSGYVSEEQGTKREKPRTYKPGDDSRDVVMTGQQGSACDAVKTNEFIMLGGSEESAVKVSSHFSASTTAHAKSLTKEALQGNVHKVEVTQKNMCSEMPMNSLNRDQEHLSHCIPHVQEDLKISSDKVTYRSKSHAELIKSIYNLSLDESNEELIQSTIQNLSSLTPKGSKAVLNVDLVNINCRQSKFEKMNCDGNTCQAQKFSELVPQDTSTDFKTSILQNLSTEENNSGDTKDAQALAYRNLWIEAEASMCKLKYELQLTRMEPSLKCQSEQTGAAPTVPSDDKASTLTKSKSSLCTGALDDPSLKQNQVKESIICSATLLPVEHSTGDTQSPKVNRIIANEVEDSVFPRLKVLKSHGDSIYSFCEGNGEQQQETRYNNNKAYGVDNTTAVSEGDSESSDDSINSPVDEIIEERVVSSKTDVDRVDAPVYYALKDILMRGASDADFNRMILETSRKIPGGTFWAGLGDGVMDRLHGPMRRTDNTRSIPMELLDYSFDNDLDWWEFGGAYDGLTKKTDLLNDVKCTTLSDEANGKIAVQHHKVLLEEPAGFPVSLERARLGLHDGPGPIMSYLSDSDYDDFPAYDKEDFYHSTIQSFFELKGVVTIRRLNHWGYLL